MNTIIMVLGMMTAGISLAWAKMPQGKGATVGTVATAAITNDGPKYMEIESADIGDHSPTLASEQLKAYNSLLARAIRWLTDLKITACPGLEVGEGRCSPKILHSLTQNRATWVSSLRSLTFMGADATQLKKLLQMTARYESNWNKITIFLYQNSDSPSTVHVNSYDFLKLSYNDQLRFLVGAASNLVKPAEGLATFEQEFEVESTVTALLAAESKTP